MKKSVIKVVSICSFFLIFSTSELLAQYGGRGNPAPKPPKINPGFNKNHHPKTSAPLDGSVIAMLAAGVALGFFRSNKRVKLIS